MEFSEMINQTINDDCFNVLPSIPDKSVDLILTDMPYGITTCEWDTMPDLAKLWAELKRIGKDNAAYVFTASQPFTTNLINSNRKWFKHIWYWQKFHPTNFASAKYCPMRVIEECIVFGKNIHYFPQMKKVKEHHHIFVKPTFNHSANMTSKGIDKQGRRVGKIYNEEYPINILKIMQENRAAGTSFHPTQKPVELMAYLIKTYSNAGDLVLDPFAGSGTTGVAAVKLDRRFIMIEKDAGYCEICRQRIKTETDQTKLMAAV